MVDWTRVHSHRAPARAARAPPDADPHDRDRDRRPPADRPANRPALHLRVARARHPDRGPARGRRRLSHSARLPAPAAHARRRRGGRRRARGRRGGPARAGRFHGVDRRSAREDPPRPPGRPAPPGGGARGDARLHDGSTGRSRGRGRDGAAAGRCDPAAPAAPSRVPGVLGRADAARAEPARARRPLRPLVPGRVRPRPRRHAHLPRRPDAACRHRQGGGRRSSGGIRRRRLHQPLARAHALAARGGGAARRPARGGDAAPARDLGGAVRGRRRHPASHARGLARVDGRRPRGARLRLHDPRAGRASRERSRLVGGSPPRRPTMGEDAVAGALR